MIVDTVIDAFRKREREVRRELENLCRSNYAVIRSLDAEMKLPSSEERGKRIAKIVGHLEFKSDYAMHFGLGYGFRKIANMKKARP